MAHNRFVVGLAGMPGAGKAVVVSVAKARGYSIIVMGNVVREEVEKRGLKKTPENFGTVMIELRQNEGESVIATRSIPKILSAKKQKVLVDGIRSLHETQEFKKYFKIFSLISIWASPKTRFKRLYRRKRSDDPRNWQNFLERDKRELSVGLGEAIIMAEHLIVNEEQIEVLKGKIQLILKKVEEKWMT